MVTVAAASAMVALTGADRFTVNVLLGASTVLPTIGMTIDFVASPGLKVNVPDCAA